VGFGHSGITPALLTYRCGGSVGIAQKRSVGAPTSRFTVSREATTEPQVSQGKVATLLGGVNQIC